MSPAAKWTLQQSREWVTQSDPWPKWPICLHVQLCSNLKVCVHIQSPNTVPRWPMWPMTHGSPGPSPHTSASLTQIYRLSLLGTVFGDCICTHTFKLLHNCTCKQTVHTGTCEFRVLLSLPQYRGPAIELKNWRVMGQHLVTHDPWPIDPFPALHCSGGVKRITAAVGVNNLFRRQLLSFCQYKQSTRWTHASISYKPTSRHLLQHFLLSVAIVARPCAPAQKYSQTTGASRLMSRIFI